MQHYIKNNKIMNNEKIRVAITHGDTNGIGYELIFKTFAAPEMLQLCTPIIYGSPKIATYHRKALNIEANFSIINNPNEIQEGRINMLTCFDDEVKVELGTPTEESGEMAVRALDRAMTDYREGVFDVLVSTPICANNIKVGGLQFYNFTHYLQTCLGAEHQAQPILMNDFMHIAIVSHHFAIKDALNDITERNIISKAAILYKTAKRDLRIDNPRIAILALNPKANGTEEKEIIEPAVAKLTEAGMCAFGPYAAEDFFGSNLFEAFDAILAMYYDQAILPFKTLTHDKGVCLIGNLPLVCTATNYTPEFDKAGKGVIDETPLRKAIYLAIDVLNNRINFDKPLQNPLPKLYHERREDKEKVKWNANKNVEKENLQKQ